MPDRTCTVNGCDKPCRPGGLTLCGMHYHRQYRHGSVDVVARGVTDRGPRYRQVVRRGHPLAQRGGRVYEHRAVLYGVIGEGPHPCHWCGKDLQWTTGVVRAPNALHVDHLNGIRNDNRIENLVASCPDCNPGRGAQARHRALVAAGWWSNHDTVAVTHPRTAPIE